MAITCSIGSEAMVADAPLTITREAIPGRAAPRLIVHCPHGTTTLDLPTPLAVAAERSLTAVAILQHYSTTGCSCTRSA
jgi:hypothetical protein